MKTTSPNSLSECLRTICAVKLPLPLLLLFSALAAKADLQYGDFYYTTNGSHSNIIRHHC